MLDELPAKEGGVENYDGRQHFDCWLQLELVELVVVDCLADSQFQVTSGLRQGEDGFADCCRLDGENAVGPFAVAGQILGTAAVEVGDDLPPGCRHQLQHVVRVVQECAQQGLVESDSGHQVLSAFCA